MGYDSLDGGEEGERRVNTHVDVFVDEVVGGAIGDEESHVLVFDHGWLRLACLHLVVLMTLMFL